MCFYCSSVFRLLLMYEKLPQNSFCFFDTEIILYRNHINRDSAFTVRLHSVLCHLKIFVTFSLAALWVIWDTDCHLHWKLLSTAWYGHCQVTGIWCITVMHFITVSLLFQCQCDVDLSAFGEIFVVKLDIWKFRSGPPVGIWLVENFSGNTSHD